MQKTTKFFILTILTIFVAYAGEVTAKNKHKTTAAKKPTVNYRYYDETARGTYQPFVGYIPPKGKKTVVVDPNRHSWAAFKEDGEFVRSGRASLGKDYCPDIRKGCRTVTGTFTVYSKKGASCKSSRFPVPFGGAPMPYCMHFHDGYAIHGSNSVPNYNASHGCVRVPVADAFWLNRNFVQRGTKVVIKPYATVQKRPQKKRYQYSYENINPNYQFLSENNSQGEGYADSSNTQVVYLYSDDLYGNNTY